MTNRAQLQRGEIFPLPYLYKKNSEDTLLTGTNCTELQDSLPAITCRAHRSFGKLIRRLGKIPQHTSEIDNQV